LTGRSNRPLETTLTKPDILRDRRPARSGVGSMILLLTCRDSPGSGMAIGFGRSAVFTTPFCRVGVVVSTGKRE